MKKLNIFPYLFVFLATFLVLQLWQNGTTADPVLSAGEVGLKTAKNDYAIGKEIKVVVQNNGEETLEFGVECIETEEGSAITPPFTVYRYTSSGFEAVENPVLSDCEDNVMTQNGIEPGEKETISLKDFSYAYFGEVGRYKVALKLADQSFESPEFTIEEPGIFTKLWRTLIYNPILNVLVALLIYIPGHYLAAAITILTIIIRTLLLVPSQKAIRAQTRMQQLQPKLEELKKKYADDQARLAQETMLLWKTHKVSPFSSCLPILIQFPILIALFYVVSGGLSPDRSVLIYDFLPEFSLHEVNHSFFGFNLSERSLIVFPLVIGGLQFLQMQLMTARRRGVNKNKENSGVPKEMETANKMMKYVMPIMIAIFTAQLPAAVGLYWGTSTFYGIVQQLVVNKEGSKPSSPDDDVQIRIVSNPHHGKAN